MKKARLGVLSALSILALSGSTLGVAEVIAAPETNTSDRITTQGCHAEVGKEAVPETVAKTVENNGKTYELVWNDEFCGDKLDHSKWQHGREPMNGSMDYTNYEGPASDPKTNIFVQDGALNLRANKYGKHKGKRWVSGETASINTRNIAHFKYGRFELRVRTPGEHGTWPAFWMMPNDPSHFWPRDGEIDWFENIGLKHGRNSNFTSIHASTVHWNTRRHRDDFAQSGGITVDGLPDKYHDWVMEWDENGFTFYHNGKRYSSIKKWENRWVREDGTYYEGVDKGEPFDKQFFFIANLAVGGWGSEPRPDTDWSKTYQIDYIRVYQTKEQQEGQNRFYLKYHNNGYGQYTESLLNQPKGTVIKSLPTLTSPRADFGGWYSDARLTNKVKLPLTLEKDTVIFAKWNLKKFAPMNAPQGIGYIFEDVFPRDPFSGEIQWAKENKVTTGWPDGTFKPLNNVDRNAMAAFLYRLAGSPKFNPPKKSGFRDMKPGDPFYKEIMWMKSTGITTGWGDNTYRPLDKVQRGAMAAFLYRFCDKFTDKCTAAVNPKNYPEPLRGEVFKDVFYKNAYHRETTLFHKEIAWAKNAKIAAGYGDGTFRFGTPIDRNALMAFVYRLKNNHYIGEAK
ncbi:S-layer homology domain-containing protein [Actinomycetaceae bacterium TAE3-ERU4]|nr:S-layer homology domain-containing protein [Actinomycetaceae bacterium TAE3-ERU4]